MKEFKLSTAAERAAGITFTAAMLVLFAALLYTLRSNPVLLIFCGLCVALIGLLLVIYCVNVMKAAAIVDREDKQLHIRGVQNYTLDLQNATLLQTFARKNGQSTIRLLVFSDKEEDIVATVPTMFTFRQGIWADPVAKEIAAELGIGFKQNVPDWELDKEKYREHVKEEAAREKAESKERRAQKRKYLIEKYKKQK